MFIGEVFKKLGMYGNLNLNVPNAGENFLVGFDLRLAGVGVFTASLSLHMLLYYVPFERKLLPEFL